MPRLAARKPRSPRSLLRELVPIAVAVAVVVTARTSLADHYVVPTPSMWPTVETDDHVVVDKLAYGLHAPVLGVDAYVARFAGPARGDVVVLRSPEDGRVLLKRVVAVPGDRVCVTGGELVLDGRPVPMGATPASNEAVERLGPDHIVSLAYGGGPDFGPLRVPSDRYLVLGDNRGDSHDGRAFGLVERDAILGRVEGVFFRHGRPTWIGLE